MPRPSEGPKCPTPEEVDQFVDFLNSLMTDYQADTGNIDKLERLVEILDWAGEQVNKRRAYSKKFQFKAKAREALLKERLGPDEYQDLVNNAKELAKSALFEEVANGTPDREIAEFDQEHKQ